MKARTDARRAVERDAARARGDFAAAVKISSSMARQLIAKLQAEGVAFCVAPFEADPQVAHLVLSGHCAAAVTEDSDLLVYQCPAVLYKMDAESGYARLVTWQGLVHAQDSKCRLMFAGEWEGEWDAWEGGLFTAMCILAGCDYLPSIPGVGVSTAHKTLRSCRSIERALEQLRKKASVDPPSAEEMTAYLLHFRECEEVFSHARVWDPAAGVVIPLRPLDRSESRRYDHLGAPIDAMRAREICCDASRDPVTLALVLPTPLLSARRVPSVHAPEPPGRAAIGQVSRGCDRAEDFEETAEGAFPAGRVRLGAAALTLPMPSPPKTSNGFLQAFRGNTRRLVL